MGHLSRNAELTIDQARELLSDPAGAEPVAVRQVGYTNDVFQVATELRGNYYVKFYTARWYKDCPDLSGNVHEELAAYHILNARGITLPYGMWGDFSCSVVSEPVLITSELPGIPLPSVIESNPDDEDAIWHALGRYMRKIHDIKFTNPGHLGPNHVKDIPTTGRFPYATNPYSHNLSPKEWATKRKDEMISFLNEASKTQSVGPESERMLRETLGPLAHVMQTEFEDPCFTQLNVHDHHFHMKAGENGWEIVGFYDFEHASASDPHRDLMCLEFTVTPRISSYKWREAFYRGYGPVRNMDALKYGLFSELLCYASASKSAMVPDPGWLDSQWEKLIAADSIDDLEWFPVNGDAQQGVSRDA